MNFSSFLPLNGSGMPEVLISGAGPTGLVMALALARQGVSLRIIDKAAGPGESSRALALQPRTLELYRQLGIVDDILAAGVRVEQLSIRAGGKIAAAVRLDRFGEGQSRYAFSLALPQDVHERILIEHLARAGLRVERNCALTSVQGELSRVTVTLERGGITSSAQAAYLVACDGAHSTVRHQMKIGFPGGAYAQSFYVADIEGEGETTKNGMDVSLGVYGFAVSMPVRQTGSVRVIGVVPERLEGRKDLDFEEVRPDMERDTGLTAKKLNWFSSYRVHHRVAEKFRVGRIFLAGDAGHVHSPAGGQGMNTGIGDAFNLAWKLAAVLQGRADTRLLATYETERRGFAKALVSSTDRAFRVMTSRSRIWGVMRRYVVPKLVNRFVATRWGGRFLFRTVSQCAISYRDSALSRGGSGRLCAGDRLPYVEYDWGDNHRSLAALDWQIHVYGQPAPRLIDEASMLGIGMQVFPFTPECAAAGLKSDRAYLVRPDGHIALIAFHDVMAFHRFADAWTLTPSLVSETSFAPGASLSEPQLAVA